MIESVSLHLKITAPETSHGAARSQALFARGEKLDTCHMIVYLFCLIKLVLSCSFDMYYDLYQNCEVMQCL